MPERVKPSVSDENAIPDGYGWPGEEALANAHETGKSLFWISPDPKRSALPFFTVLALEEHVSRIVIGGCYLKWAIRVVDGLRLVEVSRADVVVTERLFIKFTEENEHEGETWNLWLQVDGNEDELAKLAGKLAQLTGDGERDFTKPYTLVSDYLHESGVDLLVRHADDLGYMPTHVKVTGTFTCPDDLGEYGDRLHKGGVKKFFTTKETT